MTKKYDFEIRQNCIDFDEDQANVAKMMLNALSKDEALAVDEKEYTILGWEAFEDDIKNEGVKVSNLETARERFLLVFEQAILDWQSEQINYN